MPVQGSSQATAVVNNNGVRAKHPFGLDSVTKRKLDKQLEEEQNGGPLNSSDRRNRKLAKELLRRYDPEPFDSINDGLDTTDTSVSSGNDTTQQRNNTSVNESTVNLNATIHNSTLSNDMQHENGVAVTIAAPVLPPLAVDGDASMMSGGGSQLSSFSFLKLSPPKVNINAVMATQDTAFVRGQMPWGTSARNGAATVNASDNNNEKSRNLPGPVVSNGVAAPGTRLSIGGNNCAPPALASSSTSVTYSTTRRKSMRRFPATAEEDEDKDEDEPDDMLNSIVSTAGRLDERRVRFAAQTKPAAAATAAEQQWSQKKSIVDASFNSPQSILRKRPQNFTSPSSPAGDASPYNSPGLSRPIPPRSRWDNSPQLSSTASSTIGGVKKQAIPGRAVSKERAEVQVDKRMPPLNNGMASHFMRNSRLSTIPSDYTSGSSSIMDAARRRSAVTMNSNRSPHRRSYAAHAMPSPSRNNVRRNSMSFLSASHGNLSSYLHAANPADYSRDNLNASRPLSLATSSLSMKHNNSINRAGGISNDDVERFIQPPTLQQHNNRNSGFYEQQQKNPYAHVQGHLIGIQPPIIHPQYTPSRGEPLDLSAIHALPPSMLGSTSTATNKGIVSKATAAVAAAAAAVSFTGQVIQGAVSAAGNDAKMLAGVAAQFVADASRHDEMPTPKREPSLVQSQLRTLDYAAGLESSGLSDVPVAGPEALRRQQLQAFNRRHRLHKRRSRSAEILSSSSLLLDADEYYDARSVRPPRRQQQKREIKQQLAEAVNTAPPAPDSDSLNEQNEQLEQKFALNLSLRDADDADKQHSNAAALGRVGVEQPVELVDFVAARGRSLGITVSPFAEAQRRSRALAFGAGLGDYDAQYSTSTLPDNDDVQQPRALSFAQTSAKKPTFSVPAIPKPNVLRAPASSQSSKLAVATSVVFSHANNSSAGAVDVSSAMRNWDSTRRGSWVPNAAVAAAVPDPVGDAAARSRLVSQQVQTDLFNEVATDQQADDSLVDQGTTPPPESRQELESEAEQVATTSSSLPSASTSSATDSEQLALLQPNSEQLNILSAEEAVATAREILPNETERASIAPSASVPKELFYVVMSPPTAPAPAASLHAVDIPSNNDVVSNENVPKVVDPQESPAVIPPVATTQPPVRARSRSNNRTRSVSRNNNDAAEPPHAVEPAVQNNTDNFAPSNFSIRSAQPLDVIEEAADDQQQHVHVDDDEAAGGSAEVSDKVIEDDADSTFIAADVADDDDNIQQQFIIHEKVLDHTINLSHIDMNNEAEGSAITPIRRARGRPPKGMQPPQLPATKTPTKTKTPPKPPVRRQLLRNCNVASQPSAEKSADAGAAGAPAAGVTSKKRQRSKPRDDPSTTKASRSRQKSPSSPQPAPVAAAGVRVIASSITSAAVHSQHKINKIPVISSSFSYVNESIPSLPDALPGNDSGVVNDNRAVNSAFSGENAPVSPVVNVVVPPPPPFKQPRIRLPKRRSASVAAGRVSPTVESEQSVTASTLSAVENGVAVRGKAAGRKQIGKRNGDLSRQPSENNGTNDDEDGGRNSNLSLPNNNKSTASSVGSRQSQRSHKRKGQGPPRHQKRFGVEKRGFHAEVISNAINVKTPIRRADGATIYPLASSAERDDGGGDGEVRQKRYPKRKNLPPVAGHKYVYGKTPGGKANALIRLPDNGALSTPRLKNEPRLPHLLSPTLIFSQRHNKQAAADNSTNNSVMSSTVSLHAGTSAVGNDEKPKRKRTKVTKDMRSIIEQRSSDAVQPKTSAAPQSQLMPISSEDELPSGTRPTRMASKRVFVTAEQPTKAVEPEPEPRPKRRRVIHPVEDSPLVTAPTSSAATADADPPFYFGTLLEAAESGRKKRDDDLVPADAVEFLKKHNVTRAHGGIAIASIGAEFLRKFTIEVGPKSIEVGNPLRRKMTGVRRLLFYKSSEGVGQATIQLSQPVKTGEKGKTAWGEARHMRQNELFIIKQSQAYKMTAENEKVTVLARAFKDDEKMFLRNPEKQ